ncbi:hypothetical protein KDE12_01515 [Campylobacter sp. faydin G-105]|uniref:hypothetical protein n=1 Tax=Campylobacter anatolicus TaxID=2829105 RepID=UPI001BA00D22|nr:hypothetical protein [Campylobacter anatolicus]MBR8461526.1 hypothetical protein [Campylobacter anatolicus]
MKKILASSLVALAFLSGCATSSTNTQPATIAQETYVIHFSGTGNHEKYKAVLSSNDNFETAKFNDSMGYKFDMKRAVAASGIRMVSDKGVEIHFAKGEGVLNFGHGDMSLVYQDK